MMVASSFLALASGLIALAVTATPTPAAPAQGIPTVDGVLTVRCEPQSASTALPVMASDPTGVTLTDARSSETDSGSATFDKKAEKARRKIQREEERRQAKAAREREQSGQGRSGEESLLAEALPTTIQDTAPALRWTYRLQGQDQPLMVSAPCSASEKIEIYRIGTFRQLATFHGTDYSDIYVLEPITQISTSADQGKSDPAVPDAATSDLATPDQAAAHQTIEGTEEPGQIGCVAPAPYRGIGLRISGGKIYRKIDFSGACSRFFVLRVSNEVTDFLLAEQGDYDPKSTEWNCRASFRWDSQEFDPILSRSDPKPNQKTCFQRFRDIAPRSNAAGPLDSVDQGSVQVPPPEPYLPGLGIRTPAGLLSIQCDESNKLTGQIGQRQFALGSCKGPGFWNIAVLGSDRVSTVPSNILPNVPLMFAQQDENNGAKYFDIFMTIDRKDGGFALAAMRVFESGQIGVHRIEPDKGEVLAIESIEFPNVNRTIITLDKGNRKFDIIWKASEDKPQKEQGAIGVRVCSNEYCQWSSYL